MRSFIALLAVITLVVLGFILFRGNDKPKPSGPLPKVLADYAVTDASVRFTYDGLINGDDAHRAIRVSVNRSQRTLEVLQGYSGNVIQSNVQANTTDAYKVFLSALANVGFNRTRKTSNTNVVGACPLGNRFLYDLIGTGDSQTDLSIWSSTCNGVGTFGGIKASVQRLFQLQITDYDKLTPTVNLN